MSWRSLRHICVIQDQATISLTRTFAGHFDRTRAEVRYKRERRKQKIRRSVQCSRDWLLVHTLIFFSKENYFVTRRFLAPLQILFRYPIFKDSICLAGLGMTTAMEDTVTLNGTEESDDPLHLKEIGNQYFKKGVYDHAIAYYQKAIGSNCFPHS